MTNSHSLGIARVQCGWWAVGLLAVLATGCQLDWHLAPVPTTEPSCVRYVSAAADSSAADGLSWETAFVHPQLAIDAAAAVAGSRAACEVWVAKGTYHIHQGARTDTLELKPYVGLYGGFTGDETLRSQRDWRAARTVLDGRRSPGSDDRVFHVVTGANKATLNGFTITHGLADGDDETARIGGGMVNDQTSTTVSNCTFADNTAELQGGAMANIGGTPTCSNCRFVSNSASSGGALHNRNAVVELTNCIFEDNTADLRGGAMASSASATVRIAHTAFVHNRAGQSGGAIFNVDDTFVTVTNSILWKNSAEDDTNDIANSAELILSFSVLKQDYSGDGISSDNPKFKNLDDGDLRLKDGSPCIDAADGNRASPEDLLGNPRVDDPETPDTGVGQPTYADIGPYEFQPDPISGDDDDD